MRFGPASVGAAGLAALPATVYFAMQQEVYSQRVAGAWGVSMGLGIVLILGLAFGGLALWSLRAVPPAARLVWVALLAFVGPLVLMTLGL